MTDQHSTDQPDSESASRNALHLVVESPTATILAQLIQDLLNRTSLVETVTTATPDTPTVEWDHNSPCPSCNCEDLRICRAKEERWTYNTARAELEYDGQSTDTAVLSGQTLLAFCPDCDAVLATDPAEALIDWQTL